MRIQPSDPHKDRGSHSPGVSPPAQGCPGGLSLLSPTPHPQGKELPTLKDVDFLNKNEKVFVEEEQQREFMDKLKRDVEFLTVS